METSAGHGHVCMRHEHALGPPPKSPLTFGALWAVADRGMLFLQYIDYVGSWGPAIVGHAHPEVTEALHEQIKKVCPCFTALNRCLASLALLYLVTPHLAEMFPIWSLKSRQLAVSACSS